MAYTLVNLVKQVSGEMGLVQPSTVIGTSVNQTLQLLALVQRLGKDLVRDYEWRRLVKIYLLQTTASIDKTGNTTKASAVVSGMNNTTNVAVADVVTGTGMPSYVEVLTVDSATQITLNMPATATGTGTTLTFAKQDYSLPSDFDRMVSDTQWDRTSNWMNRGAKTPQEWQYLQGGLISTGPRERYRIYDNKLRIFPSLKTVYNFAFEYVSTQWVVPAAGGAATKALFDTDTDTNIFPDDLMMAGLKYYFLKAKKLDYETEMSEFLQCLSKAKAQDQPAPALSLAPMSAEALVGPWSVQDGNWPTS